MDESRAVVLSARSGDSMEVRDPRGATATVTWMATGRPMMNRWDAANAIESGYKGNWLVNRAINLIADKIASLPFRVGADPEKPNDYDKRLPLARLLGPPPGTPNPEMAARMLWRSAIINYLVTGRFAWEIDYGQRGSKPVGLWPLVMANFWPLPSDGGTRYFDGFQYRVTDRITIIEYDREEIVYGWNPSPADPRQAQSVLEAVALNVSVIVQLDQYHYGFIANDARPATLIIHGPFAEASEKKAFEDQILANHKGPLNAGKTAFAEVDPDEQGGVGGVIDVKTLGTTTRDAQLTAIYEQQKQAVSGALGVPMGLLDASGRTYDNAGAEAQNWYEMTLLPLMADLQDIVARELTTKIGDGNVGWFDLSGVAALKPRMPANFAYPVTDFTRDERRASAGWGPGDNTELDAEAKDGIAAGGYTGQAQEKPAGELALDTANFKEAPFAGAPAALGGTNPFQAKLSAGDRDDDDNEERAGGKGTMVALFPDAETAKAMRLRGTDALKASDLHVTLAHLPNFDPADLVALHEEVARWASAQSPVSATISGKGEFAASESSDGKPVTYASIDAPGLQDERGKLVARLGRAGLAVSNDHGFTPHMTLSYSSRPEAEVTPTPVTFSHVTVAHGTHRAHFPLMKPKPAPAPSADELAASARSAVMPRLHGSLTRAVMTIDQRIMTGVMGRSKRAKQAETRGEDVVSALFDADYWTVEARSAFAPVFDMAAGVARVVLGHGSDIDMDAWVDARAAGLSSQFIATREAQLRASEGATADRVATVFERPGIDVTNVGEQIYDAAIRAVAGLPVDEVRALLTRLVSGELDWDTATLELMA